MSLQFAGNIGNMECLSKTKDGEPQRAAANSGISLSTYRVGLRQSEMHQEWTRTKQYKNRTYRLSEREQTESGLSQNAVISSPTTSKHGKQINGESPKRWTTCEKRVTGIASPCDEENRHLER